MAHICLRKANIQDVTAIHGLLMQNSQKGLLLPRSYNDLYSHLRDFFVLDDSQEKAILGCCALSITWKNLAEIRSLVVASPLQRQGWGRRLVETSLSEALTLGIYRVFTLTYQINFFARNGFVEVGKEDLPQKVWAECLHCPKYPDCCDEVAMLHNL
ncbi:MAG: N-acetyltransferase [Desulfohalobiaceae bacterium]|nr:N-acetyltransferase [Desulfohalobiaceae bacterium]